MNDDHENEDTPGDAPEYEKIPPGYQHVATFLRGHPGWRKPSMVTIILFIVLLAGAGIAVITVHIADTNATHRVDQSARQHEQSLENEQDQFATIHNAEACTLRVLIDGLRNRALEASKDQASSAASRKRAKDSLPQYQFLSRGQITQPENLNCKTFLRSLSKKKPPVSKVGKAADASN